MDERANRCIERLTILVDYCEVKQREASNSVHSGIWKLQAGELRSAIQIIREEFHEEI
jgi:hypothetical protein